MSDSAEMLALPAVIAGETPEKAGVKGGFQRGHDPRRNVTKPGSGRPANAFRESIRKMLDSPKVKKAVKQIIEDPSHPQFAQLYTKLMAQGYGAPVQAIGGDPEGAPIQHDVAVTFHIVDPKDAA